MSANKCKFCNGSGWYEPKNMGGMMVEPCNRCDAHKKNQAAQKPSADVCPVCGCVPSIEYGRTWYDCGRDDGGDNEQCAHAERLAISRAAEIERLRAALESCPKPRFDVANKAKWTERRAEQLRDLSGLLRDCNDLDAASCVLARLRRIIASADRLTTSSMEHIEPSFIEFIESLCRDDRRNQSNQET